MTYGLYVFVIANEWNDPVFLVGDCSNKQQHLGTCPQFSDGKVAGMCEEEKEVVI